MTCPKCKGFIIKEKVFEEAVFVEEIRCVNCGERFFKNIPIYQVNTEKQRKKECLKLFNNFNKL